MYDGAEVRFWKLAQLSVWILEATLPGGTGFEDLGRLTAFADYIVPAALRVLGITRYSDELEAAIREGRQIEAGSPWEVEIRAHTIVACDELDAARQRAAAAGAAGDRPAGGRAAVGAVPPDALPAPPDADDLLLDRRVRLQSVRAST